MGEWHLRLTEEYWDDASIELGLKMSSYKIQSKEKMHSNEVHKKTASLVYINRHAQIDGETTMQ